MYLNIMKTVRICMYLYSLSNDQKSCKKNGGQRHLLDFTSDKVVYTYMYSRGKFFFHAMNWKKRGMMAWTIGVQNI